MLKPTFFRTGRKVTPSIQVSSFGRFDLSFSTTRIHFQPTLPPTQTRLFSTRFSNGNLQPFQSKFNWESKSNFNGRFNSSFSSNGRSFHFSQNGVGKKEEKSSKIFITASLLMLLSVAGLSFKKEADAEESKKETKQEKIKRNEFKTFENENIYYGELNEDGVPDGEGFMLFFQNPNLERIDKQENVKKPCVIDTHQLQGPFDEQDEVIYSGEWVNGFPHGKGKFMDSNGAVLEGNFHEGKAHGDMFWTFGSSEFVIICDYFFGKPKGKFLVVAETEFLEGTIQSDKELISLTDFTGKGTEMSPDGSVYKGDFLNGKKHGIGVETFPYMPFSLKAEGVWQDGRFKNGIRTRREGQTEIQYFLKDELLEKGVKRTFAKNGKLLSEVDWIEPEDEDEEGIKSPPSLVKFMGQTDENGEPHGEGMLQECGEIFYLFPDKTEKPFTFVMHEGFFQHGKKHGQGHQKRFSAFEILTAEAKGTWESDQLTSGISKIKTLQGATLTFVREFGNDSRKLETHSGKVRESVYDYDSLIELLAEVDPRAK